MNQTFNTRAKVAGEDHMAFFQEYTLFCESTNMTSTSPIQREFCRKWAKTFQRIFSISRKYPELGETLEAVYMKLNVVYLPDYYVFTLYWTSQFVSRNFISKYSMMSTEETWGYFAFVFVTYVNTEK